MGFLAQNSDFGPFSVKMGFLALFCQFPPSRQGGFYINPSRRGPVTPFSGFCGVWPGEALKGPFSLIFPIFGENGPFPVPRLGWGSGSPPGSRGGDRAPARGVDVKPPSRGGPERGSRAPGAQIWARTPKRGPETSRRPLRAPLGGCAPSRTPRRGLFYINPSRRGPVPGPGARRSRRDLVPGPGV